MPEGEANPKLQVAIENLLQCECQYLEILRIGVEHFVFPVAEEIETVGCKLGCTYDEIKAFFATLIKLCALHTALDSDLSQLRSIGGEGLSDVYRKHVDKMDVYREVQTSSQAKLDQLCVMRHNEHFAAFIDMCHETSNLSNPSRKKTLEEVLMTPLFYLAQVQTCLSSIKSQLTDHAECTKLDALLAHFEQLSRDIQREVDVQAMHQRVASMASRIEGTSTDLTMEGRTFIDQIDVRAVETGIFESADRVVFLFSDLMLVCQPKSGNQFDALFEFKLDSCYMSLNQKPLEVSLHCSVSGQSVAIEMGCLEDTTFWIDKIVSQIRLTAVQEGSAEANPVQQHFASMHQLVCGTLHSSCLKCELHNVKQLLARPDDRLGGVLTKDENGVTVLHLCAASPPQQGGDNPCAVAAVLLEASNSPDALLSATDYRYGFTALHLAILMGNESLVGALCGGAALEMAEANGFSPLYLAAQCDQGPCCVTLLQARANPLRKEATKGFTALHIAAYMNHKSAAEPLVKELASVRSVDEVRGATALHWAMVGGHYEMVLLLLKYGSHPNARDKHSCTPLHLVRPEQVHCWNQRQQMLAVMCEHGALTSSSDVYLKNDKQEYPIHKAGSAFSEFLEGLQSQCDQASSAFSSKSCAIEHEFPDASMWIADAESSSCLICLCKFGMMTRRHHCRRCGLLVCHNCSRKTVTCTSSSRKPKVERACDGCFNNVSYFPAPAPPEEPSPAVPYDSPSRAPAHPVQSYTSHEQQRKELFVGSNGVAAGVNSREGEGSMGHNNNTKAVSQTRELVNQNLEKAAERSDKLKQVALNSEVLVHKSRDFRDVAKELREQQEKQSCVIS